MSKKVIYSLLAFAVGYYIIWPMISGGSKNNNPAIPAWNG